MGGVVVACAIVVGVVLDGTNTTISSSLGWWGGGCVAVSSAIPAPPVPAAAAAAATLPIVIVFPDGAIVQWRGGGDGRLPGVVTVWVVGAVAADLLYVEFVPPLRTRPSVVLPVPSSVEHRSVVSTLLLADVVVVVLVYE